MSSAPPHNSDEADSGQRKPEGTLRRGWTTGACATAATKAALTALLTGEFPDPVSITLPKGQTPAFSLAQEKLVADHAVAAIIKDAGDDPDVTHGAMITVKVARGQTGSGISFHAGDGVGTVTMPGLPIEPGNAAINPVPRQMMTDIIQTLCSEHDAPGDIIVTISVPGGNEIAGKTWNPRLGIVGGISILGTTGIVHPFSCAAWIHSIHRGIDVARAADLTHVLGATGSTSEATARSIHDFPDIACLDMGDFAGGLLKYLRAHPIDKLTIAGGFAKLTKLAQGALDLHSGRSQVDLNHLAQLASDGGLTQEASGMIQSANTAKQAYEIALENGLDLASPIALSAQKQAVETLRGAPVKVEIIIVGRQGEILSQTGFA